MKLTLFALSFASLPTLFSKSVFSRASYFTIQVKLILWQRSCKARVACHSFSLLIPTLDLMIVHLCPTPTVWADPIGTASGGSETTLCHQ
ncbi:hypothetical protein BT96DRAFT_70209 [Gymnopus androsaceus JB14]|uniref:Uncharacterized protein n=1 Tax=Gymnopus androsaceus JB14 TaxID=1447944 RepID=A0A6A4HG74_9AGAR|nr:hypothetical protein BT96DRAFT_70209 [Gymnopus androsaceus JB14]